MGWRMRVSHFELRRVRRHGLRFTLLRQKTNRLNRLRKSNLFCHSERGEESLRFKCRKREIPRRAARLGMTKILVFPQAAKPVLFRSPCGSHVARRAAYGRDVALQWVIHHHAVGVESPPESPGGPLHAYDPPQLQAITTAMV